MYVIINVHEILWFEVVQNGGLLNISPCSSSDLYLYKVAFSLTQLPSVLSMNAKFFKASFLIMCPKKCQQALSDLKREDFVPILLKIPHCSHDPFMVFFCINPPPLPEN